MNYFSLARRVPEVSAVDPRLLVWLYGLIVRAPVVRTAYRHFVAGALAQEVTEGRALDLGTGPGYVALEIAGRRPGLKLAGLDLAALMVEKAARRAARAGLDGRGLWPQADGHRLPFADGSFDLVVSSFALHHWQDPVQVLDEIARVLAPGGRYYIADVCREPNLCQRLFAYASIPAVSLPFGSYLAYGGYYESLRAGYTRAEAQALLDRSALPPGRIELDSTWFVPILTLVPQAPRHPGAGAGAWNETRHCEWRKCAMKQRDYDVIIVGAGPAGIFAALELTCSTGLRILMLDKGPSLDKRHCPSREQGRCMKCATCALMTGWGGSGAFSDGKLTLTTQVGGLLAEIRGESEAEALVQEVDALWVRYGADGRPYSGDLDRIEEVAARAALAGLRLQHYPIRHLGTEHSGDILGAMYVELVGRGVEVCTRTEVIRILTNDGTVAGVETTDGQVLTARHVIVAPGREGADWLSKLARDLDLSLSMNPVDIGVRVELPAHILQPLTDLLYEPKFLYFSSVFDDRIRTFCVCPFGEVVTEWAGDVLTVNGHSYADKKTENTNFAVLVSKNFTEPFREPIAYGKYVARLANLLSGGIIVQRLGDLRTGRRTTEQRLERCITRPSLREATPGDLNLVLPYRYVVNILEMLDALDQVAPGVASRHTLLYGVEAKFYSSRLKLTRDLETEVHNLFAAGDGAGVTRGLVQASASGLIVAREILRRS